MKRRVRSGCLAVAVVIALTLAACGGSAGQPSGSALNSPVARPPASAPPSAEQIVAAAARADAEVTSGHFIVDASLKLAGNDARVELPQVRQLVGRTASLRLEGSAAAEPLAADGSMTLSLAGQSVAMGMQAADGKAWVDYGDHWYRLPPGPTTDLLDGVGSSPGLAGVTRRLAGTGIDLESWDPRYTMVGVETRDGVDVYHIVLSIDAQAALVGIGEALSSQAFWAALGLGPAETESARGSAGQLLALLEPSVTQFQRELWIGVDDNVTREDRLILSLSSGDKAAAAGIGGLDFTWAFKASHIGEPVTVSPPAGALPFRRLQRLLQSAPDGLLGGL